MPSVINPAIRVFVDGLDSGIWDSEDEPVALDMDIDIAKDLDTEPNECTLNIYNLSDDTINILSSKQGAIVEISFCTHGTTNLVPCYIGEIERCSNEQTRPGTTTVLQLKNQRYHATQKYINKTYAADTAVSLIIDELIDAIGLPCEQAFEINSSLINAVSLTGPAYLVLTTVLKQHGMFCHIVDGTLYVSSVWEPPKSTVIDIIDDLLISTPQPTVNSRPASIWFKIGALNEPVTVSNWGITQDKKSDVKTDKIDQSKKLVSSNTVYAEVKGISFEMFGLPQLQPDSVIRLKDRGEQLYRIQTINHVGDNENGVTTSVEADIFEGLA